MHTHTRFRTAPFLTLLLAGGAVFAAPAADGWISLFDGRTLAGWRAAEHPATFHVQDGAIVAHGERAHLFFVGPDGRASFKNFEFEAEVMTRPGANSGIFFHTAFQASGWPEQGYEIQLNNSQATHGGYHEFKKTGSLYAIRNLYRSPVRDNEWFRVRIAVRGKRITVHLNDELVVDYTEPAHPVRTDRRMQRRLGRGTFALQGHDPDSTAWFRNLRVRPLPDDLPETPGELPIPADEYTQLVSLHTANFPVIDLHAHLKGGLTVEEVLAKSRATGIGYGLALNCGLGFPTTNDAGIHAFVDRLRGKPLFVAMQAEGREWTRMFSREAIAQFDYVFTDAMTWTDPRSGKRTRLWMPDEVTVGDPDEFMEILVRQIERIMDEEPIDVYVNATFLPAAIAADYDRLWTPARMDRVIAAAVRNHVAIEISDRYRIPSPTFIKRAKAAGVKFTFGTNNGGRRDLKHLAYPLRLIRECGLQASDLFIPGETPGRRDFAAAAPVAAPGKARRFLAYVGTYTGQGSRGIYGFRFDAKTGRTRPLGCVAEVAQPSFLALHPNGRFLYAVGETGRFRGRRTGVVSAFGIDRKTGRLTLLNQAATAGPGPCHLSVDATGRLLLVANYGGGSVAALPIGKDGRLGEATSFVQHVGSGPNPNRQRAPHAHCANFSPDNRFAFVADLGTDRVMSYRVDPARGTLTPNAPNAVALPPGSGPRHLAFHPNGRWLYVINELAGTMATLDYDAPHGALTLRDVVPTLPADFTGANTCAEVAVHPNGRFVYGSNRGHDSIARFAVRTDGSLEPLGQTPCGGRHPRNFALDPTGRWLWAANRDTDNIILFRVNADTGALRPSGRELKVSKPVCVVFLEAE